MTKKKNTKMKEARATLPAPAAAEAPQPTPTPNKAAPEPAVVIVGQNSHGPRSAVARHAVAENTAPNLRVADRIAELLESTHRRFVLKESLARATPPHAERLEQLKGGFCQKAGDRASGQSERPRQRPHATPACSFRVDPTGLAPARISHSC